MDKNLTPDERAAREFFDKTYPDLKDDPYWFIETNPVVKAFLAGIKHARSSSLEEHKSMSLGVSVGEGGEE